MVQAIDRNVNKTVKEVGKTVDSELVRNTPVDTGQARSNWVASLGGETADFLLPYAPGSHLGVSETANAAAAEAQAIGVIDARKPGEDIYICNNTPYIGLLNGGSSTQAPENFVESAVQRGIEVVKNAKVVP